MRPAMAPAFTRWMIALTVAGFAMMLLLAQALG